MPGRLTTCWPPWPQFIQEKSDTNPKNAHYKQAIIAKHGAESLRKSWIDTCKQLETVTDDIISKGTAIIPDLSLEEFLSASPENKENLKQVGCFVVRGVAEKEEATKWYNDLKGYVEENRESITGLWHFVPDSHP